MCDGIADETTWTIAHRVNGLPLEGPNGFTYVFSDESDAIAFLEVRGDRVDLRVVAIPVPDL